VYTTTQFASRVLCTAHILSQQHVATTVSRMLSELTASHCTGARTLQDKASLKLLSKAQEAWSSADVTPQVLLTKERWSVLTKAAGCKLKMVKLDATEEVYTLYRAIKKRCKISVVTLVVCPN
jgi:hypothetical protein